MSVVKNRIDCQSHTGLIYHFFVVVGDRDFKFGRQIDSSKSQPRDDKTSQKRVWSGHGNHLNFGGHQPYLWNG